MLDVFEQNKYDLMTAVKRSRSWFEKQVSALAQQGITPNKVMKGEPTQLRTSIVPGNLYMYVYDPKTKEELPYYDRFPLVFPYQKVEDRSFLRRHQCISQVSSFDLRCR